MARNQTIIEDSSGNASVTGKITSSVSNGTIYSHGSMSDAIGYNTSYGTYIGSLVGGTYYLYGNGTFNDNGTIRTLIHSGNIGSQSVNYATSAGNSTQLNGQGQAYYFSKANMDASRNIVLGTNLDTDLDNGGAYSSYGAANTSWNAPFAYGGVIAYAFTSGIKAQFGFDIRHTQTDYGDLWYRTKNGTGYSTWRTMLHSGNYTLYSPSLTGTGASGNWGINITGTAVNLSTDRTNWVTNGTLSAVVGQLSWKYYGNNHTIIDASASTAPNGATIDNTNAAVPWTGTYPLLVGWNGSSTYGVRVDSARVADSSTTSSSSGLLFALGYSLTTQAGSGTIRYDHALTNNQTGLFAGSDNSNSILTLNRHSGDYYSQLGFSSNGWLYYRAFTATPINTTLGWRQLLDSSNYTSYALSIGGGTLSAAGDQILTINKSSGTNWNYIGFSVAGVRKAYFGLDSNSYATIGSDVGQISLSSPTSISGLLYLTAGISQNNLVGRPYAVWGASSATGPVVIKFPGNSGNYGMIHAVVDIYEYNSNEACTIIIGGHNWNSAWYSYGAQVIGTTNKQIRLGFKDGQYCIVIGDAASTWSYGQVVLRKIQNGAYYAGAMNVSTGYTAAIESDSYTWISENLGGYYVDPNSTSNFATLTVNTLNTGDVIDLGYTRNGSVATTAFRGINFHSTGDFNYYIGKPSGAWTQPLHIHFWSGIRLRTNQAQGGTQFYNIGTSVTVATVNDGDNNFRGYYDIIAYASDKRLKENVKPIENALDKISKLTGMTYTWNDVGRQHGWDPGKEREAGVFAQDVQEVLPEAVRIAPFDNDKGVSKSGENFLTVKYEKLVPLLIEAIKEQQLQIADLKKQIDYLAENK